MFTLIAPMHRTYSVLSRDAAKDREQAESIDGERPSDEQMQAEQFLMPEEDPSQRHYHREDLLRLRASPLAQYAPDILLPDIRGKVFNCSL